MAIQKSVYSSNKEHVTLHKRFSILRNIFQIQKGGIILENINMHLERITGDYFISGNVVRGVTLLASVDISTRAPGLRKMSNTLWPAKFLMS
jgi:hypothetical protein